MKRSTQGRTKITPYNFLENSHQFAGKHPLWLLNGAFYLFAKTEGLTHYSTYENDSRVKAKIDRFISKLNQWIDEGCPRYIFLSEDKNEDWKEKENDELNGRPKTSGMKEQDDRHQLWVGRTPSSFSIIRHYLDLNERKIVKQRTAAEKKAPKGTVTVEEIGDLLTYIQRAFLSEKITRHTYGYQAVENIQKQLIDYYNDRALTTKKFEMRDVTIANYLLILDNRKLMRSLPLLKRYVDIAGKTGVKGEAKELLKDMEKAIEKKKIDKGEPRYNELRAALRTLRQYVSSDKTVLPATETILHGLENQLETEMAVGDLSVPEDEAL